MIIDTHCHYNLSPLVDDVEKYRQKALEHGIKASLVVGTSVEDSKISLKLAQQFPEMFAVIGIHPGTYAQKIDELLAKYGNSDQNISKIESEINNELEQDIVAISDLLEENPIAIGEIGLDYYRLKLKGLRREVTIDLQKKLFEKQLYLAVKNNLPAIIHVRDQKDRDQAYWDTLEIIKKVRAEVSPEEMAQVNEVNQTEAMAQTNEAAQKIPPFVLHCASGPIEYIKEALALGAYIGIAGNITYENAKDIKQILQITPSNRMLLETDAPYLAPGEFKGQVCEPFLIKNTAEFLHQEFDCDLDIIASNTMEVFPQINALIIPKSALE
jgi:TatD DNase family protein